jgi:hypothetical protein
MSSIIRWRSGEVGCVIGELLSLDCTKRAILADRRLPTDVPHFDRVDRQSMTITATSDNQILKSNIRNCTIGLQTFATGSLPRSGLVQRVLRNIGLPPPLLAPNESPASLVRPGHAQASAVLDHASPTHKQPLIMRCCCATRCALIADRLEQIQMLSPVNHFARRSRPSRSALVVGRPRRDRYDDHRQRKNHREPKSETIWCLRHLFPLMATNRNRRIMARRPAAAL